MNTNSEIRAFNYCISFVDLLGQRDEYKGEGLLPLSEDERQQFLNKIKKTINPIYNLQKSSSQYWKGFLNHKGTLRDKLTVAEQKRYDEIKEIEVKQQRWSDGLVYFVALNQERVKCPITGILYIIGVVGSLCFVGLSRKYPIRGSVDISWGVELHPDELYGAAVANAYEIESEIAQYPRIVVGERVIDCLNSFIQNPDTDIFSEYNRGVAKKCLDMIITDFDGNYIIDYLGQSFKEKFKDKYEKLFELAFQYINEQLEYWYKNKNTKLLMRYNYLFSYFESNKK